MRVNITVPVFNEERKLAQTIARLQSVLDGHHQYTWEIVIADDASTDRTLELAHQLEQEGNVVPVVHLDRKGRGSALRKVRSESQANILSYMDVDLSADLAALPRLIDPLAK